MKLLFPFNNVPTPSPFPSPSSLACTELDAVTSPNPKDTASYDIFLAQEEALLEEFSKFMKKMEDIVTKNSEMSIVCDSPLYKNRM